MKKKSLALLIYIFPLVVFSQNKQLFSVKSRLDSVKFTVIDQNGQLGISYEKLPQFNFFPVLSDLYIKDADLTLDYEYKGKNNKFSPAVIKLQRIVTSENHSIEPAEGQIQGNDLKVKDKKGMKGKRLWLDATEDMLYLGESYTLFIERSIMEEVNCQAGEPTFSLKQQLPYYITGSVGIVALGLSQIYRNQKEDAYSDYQTAWINGQTEANARIHLEEAEEKSDQAQIWTYTGVGLVVVASVGYIYRRILFKKKKNLYKKYCIGNDQTNIQILPIIEIPQLDNSGSGSYSGVQLLWQF